MVDTLASMMVDKMVQNSLVVKLMECYCSGGTKKDPNYWE